jgi:hypothetical protein
MITEDAIAELFGKAVQDLDPAIHAILIRAERRGRRLRARRRIWLTLGCGLAVAALAGTAVAVPLASAHLQASRLAAEAARRHASTRHSGTSHTRPKPSVHRSSPAPPKGGSDAWRFLKLAPRYRMPTEQMLQVLESLLPAGSTVSNVNPYSAMDGMLEVDYNDGKGAVDLQVDIDPTVTFAPLACPKPMWPNESPRPAGAVPVSCAMRTLPDGSIERDAVYPTDSFGWYAFSVYDQRPDGITVDISVGNGIIHTLPQVDRARPPGTLAEWEAVAENPAWHLKKGWHVENERP